MPIQNPCIAVPCNSLVIFVRDVIMIEASKETMRDIMASDSMIRSSWVDGFQSGSSAVVDMAVSTSSVELFGDSVDGRVAIAAVDVAVSMSLIELLCDPFDLASSTSLAELLDDLVEG